MELAGRSIVVTGGASGIGRAMCEAFAGVGARVTVADLDGTGARAVADALVASGAAASAVSCDVRDEAQVQALVAEAAAVHGPVDVFCSNAGVAIGGGPEVGNAEWARAWETNVLAHVFGVRAVLPGMLERGSGYLVHTASAAGLLTQIGDLPYSVTKHAVVGLAEWLAITYGEAGVRVSCICPQYVRSGMTTGGSTAATRSSMTESKMSSVATVLEPADVAAVLLDAMAEERFFVLPHPEVHEYFVRRATDTDRWLRGMRRLQRVVALDVSSRGGDAARRPYPPPLRVRTNGLAVAALVSGLLFFTGIGSVLAIVFGHLALGQVKDSQGWQRGSGIAVAGLVLGYAGVAVIVLALVGSSTGSLE